MPDKLIPLIAWALLRFDPAPSMQILRRWCRDGRIPGAIRVGRELRVPAYAEYRADMTSAHRDVRGDEWVKVK